MYFSSKLLKTFFFLGIWHCNNTLEETHFKESQIYLMTTVYIISNQWYLFTPFPAHCVGSLAPYYPKPHKIKSFSIPSPNYLLLSVPCLFNGWIWLTDRAGGWGERKGKEREGSKGQRLRERKKPFHISVSLKLLANRRKENLALIPSHAGVCAF